MSGTRGSWAQKRMRGERRCTMRNESEQSGRARDGDKSSKNAVRRGAQCTHFASREEIAATGGVPVCGVHLKRYKNWLMVKADQNRIMRSKYDPGPLPLDGDDE